MPAKQVRKKLPPKYESVKTTKNTLLAHTKQVALWMSAELKKWLWLFVPTLLVSLAVLFSSYLKPIDIGKLNADISYWHDLRIPVIFSILSAGLISFVFYATIRKNKHVALFASLCLSFATLNFQERFLSVLPLLKAIFPINNDLLSFYSIFLFALLAAFYVVVGIFVVRILEKWKPLKGQIFTILFVLSGYVFVANTLPLITYYYQTKGQLAYRPPALTTVAHDVPKNGEKPDVYYIVLDRYASNEVLKSQLGFDNTAFLDTLRAQNFVVKDTAYSNYPYTSMSIGSTMSSKYHDDLEKQFSQEKHQTESIYFSMTQYSAVAQEFKKIGYSYDVIGSWFGVSNKAPLADNFYYNYSTLTVGNTKHDLAQFDSSKVNNNLFTQLITDAVKVPLLNKPIATSTAQGHADLAQYDLSVLNSLAASPQQGGRFIFAHILMPHDPYVFNADGSLSAYDSGNNNSGRNLKDKYLQQMQFISSQITKTLQTINEKSGGKAVVVLQSDEGYYPQVILNDTEAPEDMTQWSDRYLHAKYGILAAYHLPGVTDAEMEKGLTSVNIFRLILNHYFGYGLAMLPQCQFGFNEGRGKTMSYTDLTPRFSSNPDPACKNIHD